MSTSTSEPPAAQSLASSVPLPVLVVLRGVGQVFFQENALTGLLFVLGIALSSPVMALGAIVGAAVGTALGWGLKFDRGEVNAGIYGFNATLVGIASVFFYDPSLTTVLLGLAGCVVATLLTWLMRKHVPFPTYTTPFIVTTWVVLFLAKTMGAAPADLSAPPLVPNPPVGFLLEATAQSVGQVMFQASIWTGLLFLLGIYVSDQRHAGIVLIGALVGVLVARYHFALGAKAIDPDLLVEREAFDVIRIGLYGFSATLAPVALYLWRKSLIAPLLGMLLTVPLTELVPMIGLVALTAPFVLATWIVLGLYWLEARLDGAPPPQAT
jgi:urea transporter